MTSLSLFTFVYLTTARPFIKVTIADLQYIDFVQICFSASFKTSFTFLTYFFTSESGLTSNPLTVFSKTATAVIILIDT